VVPGQTQLLVQEPFVEFPQLLFVQLELVVPLHDQFAPEDSISLQSWICISISSDRTTRPSSSRDSKAKSILLPDI
jgi:hypothetical protein